MRDYEIKSLILRRRRQLMVHRIIYYVYDMNIIPDSTYDRWNRELLDLEEEFPELAAEVEFNDNSPTKTVGSSDIQDYPVQFVRKAQELIQYHNGGS